MAVARTQPGGATTGLKALLIVFIALTVLSLAGTIVLYTFQEDIKNQAEDDLKAKNHMRAQLNEAQGQFNQIVRRMAGEVDTSNTAGILATINTQLGQLSGDPRLTDAGIDDKTALLTATHELYNHFDQLAAALENAQAERDELEGQLEDADASAQEAGSDFEETSEELRTRVEELEQQHAEHRQEWERQVEELSQQLADASVNTSRELSTEREKSQELRTKLDESTTRIQELLAELASFKPSADHRAVLQVTDGTIMQTVPGEDVVYISLGLQDGVKPGMTFAVYSRTRGVPSDGKGKASIEIVNAFGTISECRVTYEASGDPILEGDPIANPIYDRTQRYRFVVAGDFDLDFDDEIEDPGGQQVIRLIKGWGGEIVDTITTQTDFVVLGAAPPLAVAPEEGGLGDTVDENVLEERQAEREAARKIFDGVLAEAKALAIPILTRTQFLHFIGRNVPENVEDDEMPSS